MVNLFSNAILSSVLLAGLVFIAWLAFFLTSRSIKKRGQMVRSLNMELFLILIPRESFKDEEGIPDREKIQVMEQLYSVFANVAEKGIWRRWEFGDPHIVWEIVYQNGEISFYVSVPSRYSPTVIRAIQAIYSDAVVEKINDYDIFHPQGYTAASYVVTSRSNLLPIKTYQNLNIDPLASIITSMAKLGDGDGAAVQVIVKPAGRNWSKVNKKVIRSMQEGRSFERAYHDAINRFFTPLKLKQEKPNETITPSDQEIVNAIEAKYSKNSFSTNIRLVSSSTSQERADAILQEIEGSFSQFSDPALNEFAENKEKMQKIIYEFSFRLFDRDRKIILSTEELASIFHLPLPGSNLPRVKWLKARSAAAPWGMNEGIILGENEFREQKTTVRLSPEDRRRHLYVVGQTGTGKTTLLQELIHQDIEENRGLAIIDPHGDLIEAALRVVPQNRWEDVIVFDPTDIERPFGLNMLEYDPLMPEQKTFIVDELINIFDKLYDLKATGGPMFEQYTRNALLLLMEFPEEGYTIVDIPRVLADKDFRGLLLSKTTNIIVKNFWEKEAAQAGGEASLANMVPYITSKFNVFIANDFIRPIIAQSKSSINFREIMDEGKILLVNLSKGRLGETNMSLLGLILVGKIMMASFSRTDIPLEERRDFFLYMDEFQNFTTDSVATILSEARKYRLNLTMAHQFIGQLPENISKAIFGNVGTMIMLRVGEEDGQFLAQYLAPIFNSHDLINLDNFHYYIRMMLNGETTQPFNAKLYPPHKGNDETANVVRNISRLKYGQEREVVEEEIRRRQTSLPSSRPKVSVVPPSKPQPSIPPTFSGPSGPGQQASPQDFKL